VRFVRYVVADEAAAFGIVTGAPGNEVVAEIHGDPLSEPVVRTGRTAELSDVRLLAPASPQSKIIGFGKNYSTAVPLPEPAEHAVMFLMPSTALIGPGEAVVIPPLTRQVHVEGELAVVIGRRCKDVPADRAAEVIFGYTCANDVTARDLLAADGQWARAKGFDTFCPLGPWIETELNTKDLAVRTRRDDTVIQDGSTAQLIRDVGALIEYTSAAFTLLPGDVILTGTPAGVDLVEAGQSVEIEIEGIGKLANPFVRNVP
jgi:2-keto-4-pentenoate hydratase/2-oxohepta-3-ene-1,7-dioic acid hydratase in catechol pathway